VTFTILLVVANTMSIAVRERRKEIGVLKTLGFTSRQVMGLVVAESVLIALIGGALGVLGSQGILWLLTHAPGMKSLVATIGLTELRIPPLVAALGFANAVFLGFVAGFACLWGVNGLKKMLGADDSLDVFGIHGVGGIVGALLTGVFNNQALGGPGLVTDWVTVAVGSNGIAAQVWIQLKGVLITIVWSGVVAFLAFKIVDMTIGLRVAEEEEREGLDISSHGETAYSK